MKVHVRKLCIEQSNLLKRASFFDIRWLICRWYHFNIGSWFARRLISYISRVNINNHLIKSDNIYMGILFCWWERQFSFLSLWWLFWFIREYFIFVIFSELNFLFLFGDIVGSLSWIKCAIDFRESLLYDPIGILAAAATNDNNQNYNKQGSSTCSCSNYNYIIRITFVIFNSYLILLEYDRIKWLVWILLKVLNLLWST